MYKKFLEVDFGPKNHPFTQAIRYNFRKLLQIDLKKIWIMLFLELKIPHLPHFLKNKIYPPNNGLSHF